jgi:hypothetical protein
MNRVFQNAYVSSPLQESLKKGETVMYSFSNPGRISERVASLKEKIGGLKWPKWDKEGFQKELEPFISSLTELEQDCHSYHESFLQSAVECTGIINTRKGSIKKSLRILHNNLSVGDRGTYNLPQVERFDARIMDYGKLFDGVGKSLTSLNHHIVVAQEWGKLWDTLSVSTTIPSADPSPIEVFFQFLETAGKLYTLAKEKKHWRKAKEEFQELKIILPSILSEMEARLKQMDMFVAALDNVKDIYVWVDDEVAAFFDRIVKETDFRKGPINEVVDKEKLDVLWVSNELMRELAEKQVIPQDNTAESYINGVCECSNNLTSKKLDSPKELFYQERY